MKVKVQRHSYNSCLKDYEPYDVPFESEVYAINENEFLVYDPGGYMIASHFEWYDFTDHYFQKDAEEATFFVTLSDE